MKPSIPVFHTAMGICELRHEAYAERHKFEFWLWALVAIFEALTVHGYTGMGRLLLGSTADRVLQYAPCPVLVVKDPFAHR